MDRGIITAINARGRILVRVGMRVVIADIQNGGGCWIGDEIEGDTRTGLHTWRHVGSGALSIVHVIGAPSRAAIADEMMAAA